MRSNRLAKITIYAALIFLVAATATVAKEGGEINHDAEHNILKAQHLEGGVRINAFIRWKCFAG